MGRAPLKRRAELLVSIPGVGPLTAHGLVITMPELGTLEKSQAASLAGCAPRTRQSGQWTGRAFVQGGRAQVRHLLYMPALSACKYNQDLKRVYRRLRDAGKPFKLALMAVMRKLVILANTLIAENRKWTPKPA